MCPAHKFVTDERDDEMDPETKVKPMTERKKALKVQKACACLGIKFSTFQSTKKPEKVLDMLEEAMVARTEDFANRQIVAKNLDVSEDFRMELKATPKKKKAAPKKTPAELKEEKKYEPRKDVDLPTMHEAYQFLRKTFVDDVVERKAKLAKARVALAAFGDAGKKLELEPPAAEKDTLTVQTSEDGGEGSERVLEKFSELCVSGPSSRRSSRRSSTKGSSRSGGATPKEKVHRKGSSFRLKPPSKEELSKRRSSAYK